MTKSLERMGAAKQTRVIIATSISTFLATWFWAHGVPSQQVLMLTTFTIGLSASGAVIWEWLCLNRRPNPLESFAAGFVLASSAATIVDQLLVQWTDRFEVLRWAYVILSIISILHWVNRSSPSLNPGSENWEYALPLTFYAVSSTQTGTHGWIIASACFLLLTLFLYKKWLCIHNAWGIVLTNILIALSNGMIYFFRPTFTMAEWRLFRLFTGSDDQIYSEAASNSLVRLGPFESIFSLHTHVPYHWFTFAWTGNFGHLINADAFTATLHIGSSLGLLYTALLTWAVATSITQKRFAGLIAIVATFAMSSSPTPLRFIYLINTSNTVSHLWLLLAVLLFVRLISSSIKFGLPVLCLVSALALIAKVPYGIVLYCGLAVGFFGASISSAFEFRKGLIAVGSLILTAVLTFKIFLEPQPWQDRGIKFLFNSANFAVGSRFYPLAPFVLISAIAIARFPFYLAAHWTSKKELRPIILFFAGSTSLSLIRFFIEGSSAENYFLSAGLLFSGVGIGVFWGSIEDGLSRSDRRFIFFLAIASCFTTLAVTSTSPIAGQSNWLVLLPVILGGFGVVLSVGLRPPQNLRSLFIVTSVTFAAVLLGSGVGSFLRISLNEPKIELASIVSQNEIKSLTWIRSNTDNRDLIASNRNLCGEVTNCNQDETRQVIAAFADRQVLIEGPRFLNGARNYPDWARARIYDVLNFAASPSKKSLGALRTYGVDWFYLVKTDPRVAPRIEFERLELPIAFENSEVAVLDLRIG